MSRAHFSASVTVCFLLSFLWLVCLSWHYILSLSGFFSQSNFHLSVFLHLLGYHSFFLWRTISVFLLPYWSLDLWFLLPALCSSPNLILSLFSHETYFFSCQKCSAKPKPHYFTIWLYFSQLDSVLSLLQRCFIDSDSWLPPAIAMLQFWQSAGLDAAVTVCDHSATKNNSIIRQCNTCTQCCTVIQQYFMYTVWLGLHFSSKFNTL